MNLNQITIPSLDVKRAIPFYEALGLTMIVQALPQYVRFVCSDGNTTFSIHLVDELPKGDGIYLYFESTQLDAKVKELVSKGIRFDESPNDKPWLWREARLKDPDGNQIILYFAGENRLNPPWRVN